MTDRTIVMAQNGRHGLRGISARNASEFEAYHDDGDNLTYTVDMASYLGSDTISSVSRVPYGLTVSNASNTTTTITQRLTGYGYVDIKATLASGDVEKFRIHIVARTPTATSAQDYIEVPVATTATRDPTTADDSTANFVAGNLWINTASLNQFTCISNTAGAARWRHHPRILAQGTVSALTGTTSETKLVTVTIAADTLGANGRLDIYHGWENNNSAGTKTRRIRFGSADDLAGTAFTAIGPTTNQAHYNKHTLQNLNATNSQVSSVDTTATTGTYGGLSGTFLTSAVDTTAASYLVFSGQLSNGADNMTLKHYVVRLTRPDIA